MDFNFTLPKNWLEMTPDEQTAFINKGFEMQEQKHKKDLETALLDKENELNAQIKSLQDDENYKFAQENKELFAEFRKHIVDENPLEFINRELTKQEKQVNERYEYLKNGGLKTDNKEDMAWFMAETKRRQGK